MYRYLKQRHHKNRNHGDGNSIEVQKESPLFLVYISGIMGRSACHTKNRMHRVSRIVMIAVLDSIITIRLYFYQRFVTVNTTSSPIKTFKSIHFIVITN